MDYVVLIKQDAEGCDYTIACGVSYVFFSADSQGELEEKVKEILEAYGCLDCDERYLCEFLVLEANNVILNHDFYKKCLDDLEQKEKDEKEKNEREMLRRLKEKYE